MEKLPYVYNELKALVVKAGVGIEDVYSVNFHSNIRRLDEGTLYVKRYVRNKKGGYLLSEGDVVTEVVKKKVCSVKRGDK